MRQFLVLFAAASLAGCTARVSTLTTIRADGSFHRRVVYTLDGTVGEGSRLRSEPYSKYFAPSPPGTRVTWKQSQSDKKVTADRYSAPGQPPLKDITILSDGRAALLTSTVDVQKLANGDLQYTERLKWLGQPNVAFTADPKLRILVKAMLPPRLRNSTIDVDRVANGLMAAIVRNLVGPPYPQLWMQVGDPDAATLRMRGSIMKVVKAELLAEVPGANQIDWKAIGPRLDDAIQKSADELEPRHQRTPRNPQESNDMTALLFQVEAPGTVVDTNGLIDPMSGHV